MAYCDSADIKTYGGWASSDVYDDAVVDQLIPVAQQMIDSWCGRTFEFTNTSDASVARTYDADANIDGRTLWLDKDLYSVRQLTVDGTVISSDSYVFEPRSDTPYWGITILGSSSDSWSYGTDAENAIVVDGHWAYSATAPQDIKIATVLLVQWLIKMRNSDLALTAPIVDAQAGVTVMPVQMPNVVKAILLRYKRHHIG